MSKQRNIRKDVKRFVLARVMFLMFYERNAYGIAIEGFRHRLARAKVNREVLCDERD